MATRRGPDGSVRVSIAGTHRATNWANVFWCNLAGGAGASQADIDAWLTAFQAAYKTAFSGGSPNTVLYVQAKATLFQTGGTVKQSVVAMTGAGGNAGAEIDDNGASIVVSWISSVYWRGGKPRTYLPGVIQGQVPDGHLLNTADATAWASNATGFRTAVNALVQGGITSTTLGFVSFRSGNADRVPPVFFNVSGASVHRRIGTQRRRLGKWVL